MDGHQILPRISSRGVAALGLALPALLALVFIATTSAQNATPNNAAPKSDAAASADAKDAAPKMAVPGSSGPQVLVAVKLRDPNFRIVHIKFRAFYNKFENDVVPLTDYDLAASASDEIMNAFSGDARARWRLATTDEKMYTESYFDEKTAQGNLPASIAADRLLLVDIGGFSLWTHSTAHRMFAVGALKMIDRPSGRILWKKGVVRKLEGYKGHTDEELLADNQKMLKELLNKLIEEFCAEIKKKVAENPI